MPDIRGDLLDRANRLAEQISATQGQFDKVIEQLKLEHQVELENLKSDLDTVRRVMKTEGRLSSVMSPSKQSVPPPQQPQQAQSQQPTSYSLMRKVSALG